MSFMFGLFALIVLYYTAGFICAIVCLPMYIVDWLTVTLARGALWIWYKARRLFNFIIWIG